MYTCRKLFDTLHNHLLYRITMFFCKCRIMCIFSPELDVPLVRVRQLDWSQLFPTGRTRLPRPSLQNQIQSILSPSMLNQSKEFLTKLPHHTYKFLPKLSKNLTQTNSNLLLTKPNQTIFISFSGLESSLLESVVTCSTNQTIFTGILYGSFKRLYFFSNQILYNICKS